MLNERSRIWLPDAFANRINQEKETGPGIWVILRIILVSQLSIFLCDSLTKTKLSRIARET